MTENQYDIVIIGAGAAGMTAGIFAAREAKTNGISARIALIDGAKKPGAKILVSGGGRCNVTNETVTEKDFFGGSSNVIRNVLRQFDHHQTVKWMNEMGVSLKLEARGKLFPTTDKARTILDALMQELRNLDVEVKPAHRVKQLEPVADGDEGYLIHLQDHDLLKAKHIVLSTGGRALPKSGSDGWGLEEARRLGHEIVPTTPALVPMNLDQDSEIAELFFRNSGASLEMTLAAATHTGKIIYERTESLLMTHFGFSGPVALDVSRHYLRLATESKEAPPNIISRIPQFRSKNEADVWLQSQAQKHPSKSSHTILKEFMPQQLAREMDEGVSSLSSMSKQQRSAIANKLGHWNLPITGSRGYSFAETTAGGVALKNINWKKMESKVRKNLYFCGEMLDVDGRLGGFNFQWAWSSGYIAGKSVISQLN